MWAPYWRLTVKRIDSSPSHTIQFCRLDAALATRQNHFSNASQPRPSEVSMQLTDSGVQRLMHDPCAGFLLYGLRGWCGFTTEVEETASNFKLTECSPYISNTRGGKNCERRVKECIWQSKVVTMTSLSWQKCSYRISYSEGLIVDSNLKYYTSIIIWEAEIN